MFNIFRKKSKYADLNALVVLGDKEVPLTNLIELSGRYREIKLQNDDLKDNNIDLLLKNQELLKEVTYLKQEIDKKDYIQYEDLKSDEINILNHIKHNNLKLNRNDLINFVVSEGLITKKPTAYAKIKKLLDNRFIKLENECIIYNYDDF